MNEIWHWLDVIVVLAVVLVLLVSVRGQPPAYRDVGFRPRRRYGGKGKR